MSPAVRATVETSVLVLVPIAFAALILWGNVFAFFAIVGALLIFGLVIFWRATYRLEQSRAARREKDAAA